MEWFVSIVWLDIINKIIILIMYKILMKYKLIWTIKIMKFFNKENSL